MKQLIPQNDNVLCTMLPNSETETKSGFVYKSNSILLYKVEKVGPSVKMDLHAGDVAVTNASGTKVVVDGIEFFFFKEENIMGTVI